MKTLFTVMFLVAGAAFLAPWIIGPWIFHDYEVMDSATRVSAVLAMPWLVLLAAALLRFRKKGLWLLTGLPFALYWPLVFLAIGVACGQYVRNCP